MKVRLGDYIQEYSVRNKLDEDIPVYSVTNSKGFCQDYFGKEVASKDKSTYKIVPQGCFAYNPSRINVGSVDWQRNRDRVIVSPLYNVFSVSPDLDQQYLYYYLKSDITLHFIKEIATGSVRDNLRLEMLYEFPINLPGLGMQRQIVARLDMLSNIIGLYKEQLDQLDTLIKARFVEMFRDPKINNKGWATAVVGDYFNVKGGKRIPKGMGYASEITNHPYLRASDMKNETIIDDDIHYISDEVFHKIKNYTVAAGDIYLTNVGVNLGMCGVIPDKYNGANLTENAVKLVPKTEKVIDGKFLALYINSPGIQEYINERKMAVGVPKLAIFRIETMPLLLPPLKLQNEFVTFVRQVDKSKFYEKALARHTDNKRQEWVICQTLSS